MSLSSSIQTDLTEVLGLTTPIICPSMAFGSGGQLAAEVTKAGGFGFMGLAFETPEYLSTELALARSLLSLPPPSLTSPLPIGVGLIQWIIDQSPSSAKSLLSTMFEHHVKAIWLSFGVKQEWVDYIRSLESSTGHKVLLFVQVHSVEEARRAVEEFKADVIVAQGIEAGGHGAGHYGLPLHTLLPSILSAIPAPRPPIVAAGGIATGSQIASLLTLGASGVAVGTRFLVTPESKYSPNQKQAIINASSNDSIRTWAFDATCDTTGWPKGIDGRALRNDTSNDYDVLMVDLAIIKEKYGVAFAANDTSRIVTWAGVGVGLIKEELPAKDLLKQLHDECVERLKESSKLFKA